MAEDRKPKTSRQGIMLGVILVMVALGSIFSLAVFLRPLHGHFNESSFVGLVPAVLAFVFFGVILTITGKGFWRIKPSSGARIGGLVMGFGFLAGAGAFYADVNYWAVAVPLGILVGAGGALAFAHAMGALMRWFPERRGFRAGWAMTAFFIGGVIFCSAAGNLMVSGVDDEVVKVTEADVITIYDVQNGTLEDIRAEVGIKETRMDALLSDAGRAPGADNILERLQDGAYGMFDAGLAMAVLGVVVMILCLVGAGSLTDPPRGWTPEGWEPADGGLSLEMTFRTGELLRDRTFLMLWLMMAGGTSIGLLLLFHTHGLGTYLGASPSSVGMMISLFLFAAGVGAFVGGFMGDRLSVPTTMFFFFLLQSLLLYFILDYVETDFGRYWTMGFYGACFGAVMTMFPVAMADYFGTRGFVKNFGLLATGLAVSALLGILLVGFLSHDSGSYKFPLFLVTAPSLVATLLAYLTKDPEKKLKAAARKITTEGELTTEEAEVKVKKQIRKKKAKKRKRKKKRGH